MVVIKSLAAIGAAVFGFTSYRVHKFLKPPPLPVLDLNAWWGYGKPVKVDTSIRPFKVSVPDEVLTDLQWRLKNHRPLAPPLEGVAQEYGINARIVKRFVDYWRTSYNWKEREQYFNKFPQFKTNVQGLDIHYLHIKPTNTKNKKVLPLLILHGWPGSVLESYKMIPLLTTEDDKRDFVFEVIAPHIPGFGFSQAASKPGLGPAQIAVVFKNLMKRLGYEKFYAHGGDFGAYILQYMTILFPNIVLGYHSNFCQVETPMSYAKYFLGALYPPIYYGRKKRRGKMYPLMKRFEARIRETGYMHIQATKPDTIGVAINDSPVGLAAYILEKFTVGTRHAWYFKEDGGLPGPYTYEELLDDIMLYWITGTATTSFRLYAETFSKTNRALGILKHPVKVPSACIRFSNENSYPGDGVIYDAFPNLVHVSDHDGGHFAAMENPEILAEDLKIAVEKFEKINNSK